MAYSSRLAQDVLFQDLAESLGGYGIYPNDRLTVDPCAVILNPKTLNPKTLKP